MYCLARHEWRGIPCSIDGRQAGRAERTPTGREWPCGAPRPNPHGGAERVGRRAALPPHRSVCSNRVRAELSSLVVCDSWPAPHSSGKVTTIEKTTTGALLRRLGRVGDDHSVDPRPPLWPGRRWQQVALRTAPLRASLSELSQTRLSRFQNPRVSRARRCARTKLPMRIPRRTSACSEFPLEIGDPPQRHQRKRHSSASRRSRPRTRPATRHG